MTICKQCGKYIGYDDKTVCNECSETYLGSNALPVLEEKSVEETTPADYWIRKNEELRTTIPVSNIDGHIHTLTSNPYISNLYTKNDIVDSITYGGLYTEYLLNRNRERAWSTRGSSDRGISRRNTDILEGERALALARCQYYNVASSCRPRISISEEQMRNIHQQMYDNIHSNDEPEQTIEEPSNWFKTLFRKIRSKLWKCQS